MGEPIYTSNSHKSREEKKVNPTPTEKRVSKVTKGPVKTKTNEVRKLRDIFISEDVSSVKSYIFLDVLVPAVKKLVYDIVTNGIDIVLYGGNGRSKSNNAGQKVQYRNFYDQKNNQSNGYRGSENVKNQNSSGYDDIVFTNRVDAEMVKQQMMDVISRYGVVTVADMYEMADPNLTAPYTAHKYGWMDVSSGEVKRERDGYILKLPKAAPID